MPPKRNRRRKRKLKIVPRLSRRVPRGMSLIPVQQKPGYKGHPFGKKFYTKLRYNEAHTFAANSTANFASSYRFRLNDLHDPNRTGVGHSAMGYDELMSIYEKSTVVAAKITVTFIPDSTVPSVVGLRLIDGNETATVDKKKAIENGDSSWTYLTTANGGNNRVRLTKNVNVKNFFGKKSIVGDPQFTLAENSSPTDDNSLIGELWVAPISAADTHGRMLVDVTIEYTAVFTEPKDLVISG